MDVILSLIYAFWLLCCVVVFGFYTSFVGNLILGTTFVRYPEVKGRRLKISLVDIYTLVAQLGITGALVSNNSFSHVGLTIEPADFPYALLLIWPELILCWYVGLRMLRRVEPISQLYRIIFLGLLVPAAFGGLYFIALFNIVVPDDAAHGRFWKDMACVLLLIWLIACRYIANFLLDSSRTPDPTPVDSPP